MASLKCNKTRSLTISFASKPCNVCTVTIGTMLSQLKEPKCTLEVMPSNLKDLTLQDLHVTVGLPDYQIGILAL